MDNHPIPQDVTGFQFRLIGNMTVKQFAYVACGVILAVILYYFPLGGFLGVLIKIMFIPLIGAGGLIIAFLPIEGRPVDVMIGNFLKALVSPNQYVYQKSGAPMSFATLSSTTGTQQPSTKLLTSQKTREKANRLELLLHHTYTKGNTKLDEKESSFLSSLYANTPTQTVQSQPTPIEQPTPQVAVLMQQEQTLESELAKAKLDEASEKQPTAQSAAHQKVTLIERQIQALHNQKQQLDQELARLTNQLTTQKSPVSQTTQPQPVDTLPQATQTAVPATLKTLPQQPVTRADLPHVSDTPNVIVGIVKDPRGNVLPNILVEVKDKDGNPVRAFKTNPLGQFASATPLTPGIYTIELEDPRKIHRFDIIQIAADNHVLLPIELTSHDAREELRKQLFN